MQNITSFKINITASTALWPLLTHTMTDIDGCSRQMDAGVVSHHREHLSIAKLAVEDLRCVVSLQAQVIRVYIS